jgi:hypothetical protein
MGAKIDGDAVGVWTGVIGGLPPPHFVGVVGRFFGGEFIILFKCVEYSADSFVICFKVVKWPVIVLLISPNQRPCSWSNNFKHGSIRWIFCPFPH